MPSITDKLGELHEVLSDAKGIAWDNCHKIYIMMDDQEVAQMRDYKYDPLLTSADTAPGRMVAEVLRWYNESCSLRFISVISTSEDGDTEFQDFIPQFFEQEEEDDEDGEY
jgi:hypothetical protein